MELKKSISLIKDNAFIIIVMVLSLYSYFYLYNAGNLHKSFQVRSDGEGYYMYLPAYIIHRDFSLQKMKDLVDSGIEGLSQQANGRYINKYAIGEAIMIMPFFLLAH